MKLGQQRYILPPALVLAKPYAGGATDKSRRYCYSLSGVLDIEHSKPLIPLDTFLSHIRLPTCLLLDFDQLHPVLNFLQSLRTGFEGEHFIFGERK
jgi:hypothetical protein